MRDVVVTHAVRTPIGKFGGSLRNYREQELASIVIKDLMRRSGIAPDKVDEVILGNVKMNTRPMNPARFSWLQAGLPVSTPGFSIHRACSSGSQAIFDASQIIALEDADVIVAGGVENMSKSCYYLRDARTGVGNRDMVWRDALTEGGPGSTPAEIYGDLPMGITAEIVAEQYGIDREMQDTFALLSQQRAIRAIAGGEFREQIVPVGSFDTDEFPRETTIEQLRKLKPVFRNNGTVTAGNSSGRNDGAAALMVMSREKADQMKCGYYLRHVASAVTALSPSIMGVGPVEATRKALSIAGLSIEDIGLIELNEAFAAQSVAVLQEWAEWSSITYDALLERTNVNGGAIALGHPLGATGAILTTKLFYKMKKLPCVRYGLVTMCIGGGMGFASIFERVERRHE